MQSRLIFFLLLVTFLLAFISKQTNSEIFNNKQIHISMNEKNEQNQIISLNTSLDNPYCIAGSKYIYLYIDAKSGKAVTVQEKTPLNISLVLDRSGSMSSERKLEYAKDATKFVVDNLGGKDNVSIVVYDHEVNVLSASSVVSNKTLLKQKIGEVHTGGSTNLSGGMLEGYHQVKTTYSPKHVNRVLLLSDGLANVGITENEKLREIVKKKNAEDGISISTFGVGTGFNEDLMTELAEYGSGNYYFIASADQIPDIFAKELKGLLSVVAQNAKLEVNYPSSKLALRKVYGYPFADSNGKISIDFKDIFSEEQKAVLLKFEIVAPVNNEINFETILTYDDATTYKREVLNRTNTVKITSNIEEYNKSFNEEVKRNIVLFESNEMMQEAMKLVDDGKYEESKKLLKNGLQYMEESMKTMQADSFMVRQKESMMEYEKNVQNIEQMDANDVNVMQKSSKMSNYNLKRKK